MPAAEEEHDTKPVEQFDWDVDMEAQLFYAIAGNKPVGVNKHFNMIAIWNKLSNSITKDVTTEDIWKHLETLYDLQLLDDTEPVPFPNTDSEFSLPEDEYYALIKQKCRDTILSEDFESALNVPVESPSPKLTVKSSTRSSTTRDSSSKAPPKKDPPSSVKNRKESSSSTDTHLTNRSDKDSSSRRRDSRDSNASSTRDGSTSRKSSTRGSSTWDSLEEIDRGRGRRRAQPATPPTNLPPAKRRRL